MPAPAAFSVIRTRAAVVEELRRLLPRLEGSRPAEALPFGVAAIDRHLPQGGLPCGALHEVVAEAAGTAAAFGFIVALLARLCSPATQCRLTPPPLRGRSAARSAVGRGVTADLSEGTPLSGVPATQASRGDPDPPPQGGREKLFFVLPNYGLDQSGRLYGHGLRALGLDPAGAILVETAHRRDTLWAIEEALRSRAVAAVAGAIDKLDLKTSQRLHLAAADAGLPLFLLRQAQMLEASAAATRWRVGPAAAARDRFGLVTLARWHLLLERCRNGRAGEWIVEYDHVAHRFSLAAALADPALPRRASEKYEKSLATPY
jgi:protein ImuA